MGPLAVGAAGRGILTVTAARPHAFGPEAVARLTAVARPLEAALALLERADWGTQLAGLAHDLNTPLSSIRGFLALVGSDAPDMPPAQLRQYVQLAALATEQLVHLVGDMRDVLALAQRRLALRPAPLAAAELLRATAALLGPLADEAGARLVVRVAPGLPPLLADRRRLERVLGNLAQNALKYSAPGGQVWLGAEPAGAGVRLVVEDEGPGVAAADLPRLFEPAFRGVAPAGRAAEGLGLGLAVAQAIARAHGGRLWAANRPGGGARFVLDLPPAPPVPDLPQAAPPAGATPADDPPALRAAPPDPAAPAPDPPGDEPAARTAPAAPPAEEGRNPGG